MRKKDKYSPFFLTKIIIIYISCGIIKTDIYYKKGSEKNEKIPNSSHNILCYHNIIFRTVYKSNYM